MNRIVITFILISFLGCKAENQVLESSPIIGSWYVKNIIENEKIVSNELPVDSIIIDFQKDGKINGISSRNMLLGNYQLFNNDSIWVSTIGGTEVNETKWEKKFKDIMPNVTFFDLKKSDELLFFTTNRKNYIVFIKNNQL